MAMPPPENHPHELGGTRTQRQSMTNGAVLVLVLVALAVAGGAGIYEITEILRRGPDGEVTKECAREANEVRRAERLALARDQVAFDVRGLVDRGYLASRPRHHVVVLRGPSGLATQFVVTGVGSCRPGSFNRRVCAVERKTLRTAIAAADADGPEGRQWWDAFEEPPHEYTVVENVPHSVGNC
jgi:hypothetical protein